MRVLLLLLVVLLSGCGSPLSLLTGGGPNVAANVQAGETNAQTIGTTEVNSVEQSLVRPNARVIKQTADTNDIRTEAVEQIIIEKPVDGVWVIFFILWSIFLFWLPSPNQVGEALNRRWGRGS